VQALAADGSGRFVAWATGDGNSDVEVHWRDPAASAAPQTLTFPTRGLLAVAIDPVGGRVAGVSAPESPGGEQTLWVRDPAGIEPRSVVTRRGMCGGAAFSPDGRLFAVADVSNVLIYRTGTWEFAAEIPVPLATTCLAFSPDGRRLAAVGFDGVTTLLDPSAGKRVFQLRSLAGSRPDDMAANARVAFSPDGSRLISTNWDGSVNVWDGSSVNP
jgi:WD40 repeat protein